MKKRLVLLAFLCALQLLVPAGMIYNKYDILKNGAMVKFQVRPIDPYDPFRGRYVAVNVPLDITNYSGRYGIVLVNENGFGNVVKVTDEKPAGELYVKSLSPNYFRMPIERYYMDEKLAPEAERLPFDEENRAFVVARIKNGNVVLQGLYVNDVPIEEYLKGKGE